MSGLNRVPPASGKEFAANVAVSLAATFLRSDNSMIAILRFWWKRLTSERSYLSSFCTLLAEFADSLFWCPAEKEKNFRIYMHSGRWYPRKPRLAIWQTKRQSRDCWTLINSSIVISTERFRCITIGSGRHADPVWPTLLWLIQALALSTRLEKVEYLAGWKMPPSSITSGVKSWYPGQNVRPSLTWLNFLYGTKTYLCLSCGPVRVKHKQKLRATQVRIRISCSLDSIIICRDSWALQISQSVVRYPRNQDAAYRWAMRSRISFVLQATHLLRLTTNDGHWARSHRPSVFCCYCGGSGGNSPRTKHSENYRYNTTLEHVDMMNSKRQFHANKFFFSWPIIDPLEGTISELHTNDLKRWLRELVEDSDEGHGVSEEVIRTRALLWVNPVPVQPVQLRNLELHRLHRQDVAWNTHHTLPCR